MNIIDTHAHVDQLKDIEGALTRARESGVTDIVAMSVDLTSMQDILSLTQKYPVPKIHPALGIHPGKISEPNHVQALEFLKANIRGACAVGETGLDYWYPWVRKDMIARAQQKDSFQVHLDLAVAYDMPIVIHSRGAWRDCLTMAQAAKVKGALFHWYSGPVDILDQILSAGYYVSTSPSVGYSKESRLAMSHAPMGRILIETDSPVTYREGDGTYVAEPKDVVKTLQALSRLKGLDEAEAVAQVNQNAKDFFRI